MQTLDAEPHHVFTQPAMTPVLPGELVLVTLLVSLDQGRTWRVSGTLKLPTVRYETAARLFLMTAMSMAAEDDPTNVVWQAHAWSIGEGKEIPFDTPPLVSLRSDGQPSNAYLPHRLPPP
ncbi:hypothetical protein [Nonomuraea sp. B19D2]|uniref:hypothetical protein n=1 Tax=Nonomuraea sp. B19D2 TaxID=3159561 RepID=UPI0032DBF29B